MTIVVMGSLHLDLMVDAAALPRLGETAVGHGWRRKPGGKGGNQAVAAARDGARVAMIGLVGADDFGIQLRDHLRNAGVDDSGVMTRTESGSGMSVAITDRSGDYGAIIVSGVNLLIDEQMIEAQCERIGGCSHLVLQNEVPESANVAAARLARAGGGRVVLNAAPARPLSAEVRETVDILIVNALEAEALAGRVVADLAEALAAAEALLTMVPCAVVTVGGAGIAIAASDGMRLTIPGHDVPVVSTHGAGDCFVGAFAARLDAGDDIADALGHANAAAALTVSLSDSARAGIDAEQVRHFLRHGAPVA